MLGVETDSVAGPLAAEALEKGLVVGTAGERVLRLTPPLTITDEELAAAVEILTEVLS
jgi:acetylornithine aminotransferase